MKETDRICGNCKYHKYVKKQKHFVCFNKKSDSFLDWTHHSERCIDFAEKETRDESSDN